jgi:hypothetical protein
MRRALASLLLALFSFPLILPVLRADAESSLPSCCRRAGKHRCSMDSTSAEAAAGTVVKAIQPKCSSYPAAGAPGNGNIAFFDDSQAIRSSLLSYPSVEARADVHYRVSFSRSRQKRGPPTHLS